MGEFDISLIEEFRQRESLYDRNSLQFKDKLYNAQQWQEISNKLGYDVSILKDRMLQLRNRYNLEKRRMEQLREETGKHHESPWGLYDSLQFLSGHIKSRRRYKSILPVYNHKDDSQLNDSGNDYSAMGVDDSAMLIDNSAKDDMMHSPGGVGGSSSQPFPNGLFSVKVEENMSEGHASEVDTENSQSTRGNDHFADNLNVMTEIHSSNDQYREQMRRLQNQQMQMQQQQQQQQEKHHQEQQQQQHENRQQQLQQHNSHQQILPTRIIKRSLGHNNPMISVRSDMTHPKLRKLSRPPQMATPTIGKRVYEDDCGHMVGSAYNNFPKQMRLSPRENKYNAFGNFISSSLLDLPQKMALELVEKFTSDIVKALTAKMENMEAAAAAKAAAAAPTTVDLDDDNEEHNHHHQQHHHHNHQQQQQRQEMQNEDSNDE
ncbi:protein kinase 4 isoform X1 [Stomoxys calcitrans]|uniref:protein kinase 4 isoform X1 n=1 Tax=Stomoxys calcitrans TaxID=35570 RepID=UPI0027E3AC4B|nr:protein kinase 4 isoform X1 [Stomoxys calcitrans]XP_013099609.2 protein kinase 4 isoform X1 [Stomoxys calcitrans]